MMKKMLVLGLVLLFVVSVPMIVAAEDTSGTQDIKATIAGFIEVKTADTLQWDLEIGENTAETEVTVRSNDSWSLNISASNDGYFEQENDFRLKDALHVMVDETPLSFADKASHKIGESDSAGEVGVDVSFSQNVDLTDRSGNYSITITYTAQSSL